MLVRALLPQLVLLTLVAILYSFSLAGVIPSPQELNTTLVRLFTRYGLPFIAACSFVENLVGFNAYFPGAFTILTGMSLTAGHPKQALLTYVAIYIPAYAANLLSYLVGRCREAEAETSPPRSTQLWSWFFLTYWHPQLATLTALAAGASATIPLKSFMLHSLASSFGWSIFWALIIYHFGLPFDVSKHFASLFVLYLLGWTLLAGWKASKKRDSGV